MKMEVTLSTYSRNTVGLVVAAAACYMSLLTPHAEAGTYKLYSCNVPGRSTPLPSVAPWSVELDGVNTLHFNECASGKSFGIALNVRMMRAFGAASLALVRPATGPRSAIGVVRYRTWITAELSGQGAPAFVDDGGAFSPPGGTTPDHAPWVSAPFSSTNPAVYIRLHCSAGDCYFDSARPLQVRGVEVDLHEDVPPAGVIEAGTLVSTPVPKGIATLSFSATDEESGVARVDALLGDVVVASEDLESSSALCPHTDWNACPQRHAGDFMVDTSRIPPGEYPITLRITDAAGNRRVVSAPKHATVGQQRPPESGAVLTGGFVGSRTTYTTNFGRSVLIRGRLADGAGRPIAHARIVIVEKPATNQKRPSTRSVTTDAQGRFKRRVSGRGPSRSVELRYYARAGDTMPSVLHRLRLRVRASSTLKVSLRGVIVRYAGRVLSRPLPRGGKQVFIQGRAAGGAWQRFAVRRTDKTGRFAGRYRLRVRRPGVKLQFRVEVSKQPGYPFAPRIGGAITRVVR